MLRDAIPPLKTGPSAAHAPTNPAEEPEIKALSLRPISRVIGRRPARGPAGEPACGGCWRMDRHARNPVDVRDGERRLSVGDVCVGHVPLRGMAVAEIHSPAATVLPSFN